MSDDLPKSEVGFGRAAICWLVGCGFLFALSFVLGWIDDTTELTPDHSGFGACGFVLSVLAGILAPFALGPATRSWPDTNSMAFTAAGSLLSFIIVLMVAMPAEDILAGLIDFPAAKTVTYNNVLMKISRANQTHGKARGWHIHTSSDSPTIEISKDDYDLMLQHRGPDDKGTDPDEITSHGYFCAQVTLQKAGDALRIMHAGHDDLPRGSIIVCPPDFARRLHL